MESDPLSHEARQSFYDPSLLERIRCKCGKGLAACMSEQQLPSHPVGR